MATVGAWAEIWKVTPATAVAAGTTYIDNDVLTVQTVYATKLSYSSATYGDEAFTCSINLCTDGLPTAENLTGTERSGRTPLVITAKQDAQVTFYYRRQAADQAENDSRDLKVFDQAAITTAMTGTFVLGESVSGSYNSSKTIALEKGHVYTVTSEGTTTLFFGISYSCEATGWSIDFAALGGNYPDKTKVTISSTVATIGGTTMGTCTVGEEALDSKFVLQTGTNWTLRMENGLFQDNGGGRAMGFRNCTANQIITIVGTGDPNPSNATLKTQDGNTYIYTVIADGDVKFTPARKLYFTSVSVETPAATPVETPAIELTPDATGKQWSLAEMPGYDVELQVEYKTDTKVAVTYDGEAVTEDGISAYMKYEADFAGKLEAAVSELESTTAVEGATVTYTSSDATVLAFKGGEEYAASGALADIAFLKEGSAELTVAYAGDADNAPASATVKVNVAKMKYSVEMSSDSPDNDKWEIVPDKAVEGTTVTATYKGKLKLKGMKAVKEKAPIDLSKVTEDLTLQNGDVLTGTLKADVKISIAAGATVKLRNVNITGDDPSYQWAGLSCLGDATIILAAGTTNTVKGFDINYPGIHVPADYTLTIQGTGALDASSNGCACGIGGGNNLSAGNIVIKGGSITATGGNFAAGIGAGDQSGCGTITISGGTVVATGGSFSAGIGTGQQGGCGNITISGGTVVATGGGSGAGIGTGLEGECGTITISGGTVEATGGNNAAGIGSGYSGGCGDITITDTVTSVKATKGAGATHSISAGYLSSLGSSVTIGGVEIEDGVTANPYTYTPEQN